MFFKYFSVVRLIDALFDDQWCRWWLPEDAPSVDAGAALAADWQLAD